MVNFIYKVVFCIYLLLYSMYSANAQDKSKEYNISDINSSNVTQFLQLSSKDIDVSNTQSIITQRGDTNLANAYLKNDILVSIQQGNGNSLYYQDTQNANPSHMNITMIGDNNNVQVWGSNSISNGMSIEIFGHNRTVQVINK
ncbi:hypothetical protein ACR79B_08945 [Sphingobacterium spiritivorum]|uniref:hypothetical protein n=1 Tax=Sphingobacterium spiritivorum TaxID=258 RepID=UPI003DA4B3E2